MGIRESKFAYSAVLLAASVSLVPFLQDPFLEALVLLNALCLFGVFLAFRTVLRTYVGLYAAVKAVIIGEALLFVGTYLFLHAAIGI